MERISFVQRRTSRGEDDVCKYFIIDYISTKVWECRTVHGGDGSLDGKAQSYRE